ncbi:hypothetical protein SAMN04488156_1291, partial [Bacillus sp. 166amftsu]
KPPVEPPTDPGNTKPPVDPSTDPKKSNTVV